jgi:transcriptional regulator with XRE-family HTH domain
MLNGNYIKSWRKQRHISARVLALELGYRGREYIKKLESGYFPITAKFAKRFNAYKNQVQRREQRENKIETRYALPPQIKILARPRRCAMCNEWFIFPNATDRVCTDRKCRRAFQARQAKAGTQ